MSDEDDDVSSDIGLDDAPPREPVLSGAREYRLLKHMQVTPQFFDENGTPSPDRFGVSYVYIDDFGGWAIVPNVNDSTMPSQVAQQDLDAARNRLSNAGLGCHKEMIGLPCALGYEVAQQTRFCPKFAGKHVSASEPFESVSHYVLKGNDDKLFPIIALRYLLSNKTL